MQSGNSFSLKVTRWLWILTCLVFLLTPGQGTSTTPAPAFKVTTVYLVRHAEKAATPADNPPLLEAGRERARKLAQMLSKAGIKTIFASQFLRTQQTAEPLAQLLGLTSTVLPVSMDTMNPQAVSPQYLKDITKRIYDNAGQSVLIVGHNNTVPAIIKELGGDLVPTIPDTEYDNLFVVTVVAKGKAKVAHLRQ
ncbi:MAG: phosphoglycerate mutase family protein [Blastocatellia bacterium]